MKTKMNRASWQAKNWLKTATEVASGNPSGELGDAIAEKNCSDLYVMNIVLQHSLKGTQAGPLTVKRVEELVRTTLLNSGLSVINDAFPEAAMEISQFLFSNGETLSRLERLWWRLSRETSVLEETP